MPPVHVTLLLPLMIASELEHLTSTTVPGFTGNSVVVSIVLVHSVFSPVQSGTAKVLSEYLEYSKDLERMNVLHVVFLMK